MTRPPRFYLSGLPTPLSQMLGRQLGDCEVEVASHHPDEQKRAQLACDALILFRVPNALSLARRLSVARQAGQPVFLLYPPGIPMQEELPWLSEARALDLQDIPALLEVLQSVTHRATVRLPQEPAPDLKMVHVPPGEFWMGSVTDPRLPDFDPEAFPNEAPRHRRQFLSPFFLSETPVTNAHYRRFVEATGAAPPRFWTDARFAHPAQPVVGVSWTDARRFCKWFGAGHDLPTEAEWEWAARGPKGHKYPWGSAAPGPEHACFGLDLHRDAPAQVGRHPDGVGPFGHQDLSGLVWEWCTDDWAPYGSTAPPLDNKVIRGGAWSGLRGLRAAERGHASESNRLIGFRVACR